MQGSTSSGDEQQSQASGAPRKSFFSSGPPRGQQPKDAKETGGLKAKQRKRERGPQSVLEGDSSHKAKKHRMQRAPNGEVRSTQGGPLQEAGKPQKQQKRPFKKQGGPQQNRLKEKKRSTPKVKGPSKARGGPLPRPGALKRPHKGSGEKRVDK